ncbi:MAG: sterol desaturase family protein [Spongiibacter marinus]|uniref:sterol desaturase family protein n=1 Tax=Spongiibacter marinus TaxID=354246 RepID=UPI003C66D69D
MQRDAMLAFRERYRRDISPYYSGWLHMFIVAAMGVAVIAYAVMQTEQPSPAEYLALPITLILVNFAEYYAHRWLGHRKTRLGGLFYKRHTGDHHSFFLHDDMDYANSRDWRVVLFPSYLIVAFIVGLAIPGALVLNQIASPNIAYLYVIAAIGGYLLYEVLHFSYHIPEGAAAERVFACIPGWRSLRHSHRVHHQRDKMAACNFNITLPIFDYLLKTRQ